MPMSTGKVLTQAEHDALVAKAVAERDDRIEYLEYQVDKFKHLLFGRRSEKQVIPPGAPFQSELFTDVKYDVDAAGDESSKPPKSSRGKSRARFSEETDTEIDKLELAPVQRICKECSEVLVEIGVEESEQLHIIPARVVRIRRQRVKYACRCKGGSVVTTPLPATAFPKSRITDAARAHIVVQKFKDHCPYYRQSGILKRSGVEISDRTLCHYGIETADRLAPIVVAMRDELLASDNLQADETTIPVLKTEKEKPGAHRGYLWAYAEPRGTVVFDYCKGRGADYPTGFLEGFSGLLQTDRYEGYQGIRSQEGITDIGCWAHARRRFSEAAKTANRRCKPIIELIRKLYGIEKIARESQLAPADRARLRSEKALPVLNELKGALQEMVVSARPKTPLGMAVGYALNHWPALCRYVEHGDAEIDNNLIENSMRPVVLGRKNYLFAGSEIGAEAAAILYSITDTCRRLDVPIQAYLIGVFQELATIDASCAEEIRALTPAQWKKSRESTMG